MQPCSKFTIPEKSFSGYSKLKENLQGQRDPSPFTGTLIDSQNNFHRFARFAAIDEWIHACFDGRNHVLKLSLMPLKTYGGRIGRATTGLRFGGKFLSDAPIFLINRQIISGPFL